MQHWVKFPEMICLTILKRKIDYHPEKKTVPTVFDHHFLDYYSDLRVAA